MPAAIDAHRRAPVIPPVIARAISGTGRAGQDVGGEIGIAQFIVIGLVEAAQRNPEPRRKR